jgi:molybdate transport system permease protein
LNSQLVPFLVTARIALGATVLVLFAGLPLARLLSRAGRRGARWVPAAETLLLLPLVLPPTTLGYFLLVLLGRRSPIGELAFRLGVPLVFSVPGAVIAAAIAAFPLFLQPAKVAFDAVDPGIEQAARLLGAPERFVFFRIALPLAARGVLAGTVLAFARAVGDFGTTLMVAGAIPGRTETVAIAIYEAVQAGDDRSALLLGVFISLFSLSALAAARVAGPRAKRRDEARRDEVRQ